MRSSKTPASYAQQQHGTMAAGDGGLVGGSGGDWLVDAEAGDVDVVGRDDAATPVYDVAAVVTRYTPWHHSPAGALSRRMGIAPPAGGQDGDFLAWLFTCTDVHAVNQAVHGILELFDRHYHAANPGAAAAAAGGRPPAKTANATHALYLDTRRVLCTIVYDCPLLHPKWGLAMFAILVYPEFDAYVRARCPPQTYTAFVTHIADEYGRFLLGDVPEFQLMSAFAPFVSTQVAYYFSLRTPDAARVNNDYAHLDTHTTYGGGMHT